MKKLASLLDSITIADAVPAALKEIQARLEAEQRAGLSQVNLDGPLPPAMAEIATKLLAIPVKLAQAEKKIENLTAEISAENDAVAVRLNQIADKREKQLRARLLDGLKPFIANIGAIERGGFFQQILAQCDEFSLLQRLRFAGSFSGGSAVGGHPVNKAKEILALREVAGL